MEQVNKMAIGGSEEILKLIPHRPPFLLVDKIISCTEDFIVTEKKFPTDWEIYKGHYPESPITPGVLLCEAVFQSGALLMATRSRLQDQDPAQIPVLTRIQAAKFKRGVKPGDVAEINVKILETIANTCFFKGTLKVHGKVAMQVEFGCSVVVSEG